MSIFGMVVVDSWMLYKGCTGGDKMSQTDYYKALIDGLIDNTYYDQSVEKIRVSARSVAKGTAASVGTSGTGLHLTPTKRKRESVESTVPRRLQYRCKVCQKKTVMVCSICRNDGKYGDSQAAYCHPVTNRGCFRAHIDGNHS
jgi:hypothetical protein